MRIQRCGRRRSYSDGNARYAKLVESKRTLKKKAFMAGINIGVDLAKNGFQLRGAAPERSVAFRNKSSRTARHSPCIVVDRLFRWVLRCSV
jgi:hypothetical protein